MKVTINGMVYEYDGTKAPMSEALAIEHVYKRRYAQWQEELAAGSAEAMCVLAWIILRRDGTNLPYEDIIEGKFDFDLMEMLTSLAESAQAEAEEKAAAEAEGSTANPTPADPGPAGTDGTGTATSASSANISTSGPGKSTKSSASRTSRP